ncbi:ATP-binding protein [Glaciecola sp. 1036]|uniref:hybrid sensor histidine kinase/response regulator n=1 Tax=Alteromonadaceae TaxID=72275 RepID=UPI003D05E058
MVLFIWGLLFAFFATAQETTTDIIIDGNDPDLFANEYFAVYQQRAELMDINRFLANKNYLPFSRSKSTNFGFANNGLWFHASLTNQTELEDFVINIRYALLNEAKLYIYDQGKLIYSGSDGILEKNSYYPMPTFKVKLPKDRPLELYLFASSSTLSIIAPIHITEIDVHNKLNQYDFLLWGGFYGAALLLAGYAVFYSFQRPDFINGVFFLHILIIICWLFKWSGHAHALSLTTGMLHNLIRPEELLILMCITGSFFNLTILPKESYSPAAHITLVTYIFVAITLLVTLIYGVEDKKIRYMVLYGLGFTCVFVNFWASASSNFRGYGPAQVIVVGWVICGLGATMTAIYLSGLIQTATFNSQVFITAQIIQAGGFLYAIVSKNHYNLETEVRLANADAQNNFNIIEEQNVHLDLARKEAEKASDVKSQFLANMSHEIRTPLNAIVGFSRELIKKNNVVEKDEHVRIINSAASDLLNLVNDILDFSKMEAGLLTLSERPFSPRELFEDIAGTMSKTAHLKQLEFLYEVNALPPFLIGDSFKVKQLVTNLLGNALKFTNYGYISLKVESIFSTSVEATLRIQVTDSGIGINPEEIENIFKAFHQLDDELNRSYQGTGLGLVICQELAYLMHGSIKVASQPSVGSTFTVEIPFQVDTSKTIQPEIPFFAGKKALVFDPWGMSRRLIVKQLQQSGFNVSSFETLELMKSKVTRDTYIFITLPHKYLAYRSQWLSSLRDLDPTLIILLYSGPAPSNQLLGQIQVTPHMVRLPLTARKLEVLESPFKIPQTHPEQSELTDLPAIRMLAVDDMELNLRLLETWLKNSPINLDLAYDARTAIKKCEQTEYDIILMDIQMPDMDGIQAAKMVRKTTYNLGTPIIAVTAHALKEERDKFLNNGLDDFLPKPIKQNELIRIIELWCHQAPIEVSNIVEETEEPELNDKSIDWALAISRSMNSEEEAFKFMDKLVANLEQQIPVFEELKAKRQVEDILYHVHKLHGPCCYTGVPKLQRLLNQVETSIKQNQQQDYTESLSTIIFEMQHVISEWSKRKSRQQKI